MPNVDSRFGLVPTRYASGAPYNGAYNAYYIPSSDSTAMFIGDPVTLTGTATDDGIPHVIKSTVGSGNLILGAIVGFEPNPNALETNYRTASTNRVVYVADDPNLVFKIQGEGTLAKTSIGLNAVLIYTHSGDTITGKSGAELDCGTTTAPATTAAFQLKILRLHPLQDNEFATANPIVEVKINNHQLANITAGV